MGKDGATKEMLLVGSEGTSMMAQRPSFFRKYFLAGQQLEVDTEHAKVTKWEQFHAKHRKYIAVAIPFCIMHALWWLTAIRFDFFSLYPTRWELPITMIFGALLAGMTSEGGGAVAFPVMTLLLGIRPAIARDFAIMIQSIGMACALFVVVYMNVIIEKRAIIFCTMGSVPGMITGFTFLDPLLDPSVKKMLFVSIWASFAMALYKLNSQHKRKTYPLIQHFKPWKALVLIVTGFVGGIFVSFAGSGVDITAFSILTLFFRVSEKTVTPTTVCLMGLNSLIAFYWRGVWMSAIDMLAFEYLAVSAPVAFTLAPLGSFLGSHFHRLVLASMIYCVELFSLVGWLASGPRLVLVCIAGAILAFGFTFFSIICKLGEQIIQPTGKAETAPVEVTVIKTTKTDIKETNKA